MDEFDLIARYLAPLAGEGALGLEDDVAFSGGIALTKDVIVEGVHFLSDDPLDMVARKAIRVNASDLIAKGCRPTAMLLGCVWPRGAGEADMASFAKGLAIDLDAYGLTLLGGDTTRHRSGGPLTVSVTMLGSPIGERPVLRSGAKPGDLLVVMGTVGDAGLGLRQLRGSWSAGPDEAAVVTAYRLPHAPLPAAALLARHASAGIDVSDGLLADADHLAHASDLTCLIEESSLPLSSAGGAWLAGGGDLLDLATAGDDYVPLMALGPERLPALREQADGAGLQVTAIGRFERGSPGVLVETSSGEGRDSPKGGWSHF